MNSKGISEMKRRRNRSDPISEQLEEEAGAEHKRRKYSGSLSRSKSRSKSRSPRRGSMGGHRRAQSPNRNIIPENNTPHPTSPFSLLLPETQSEILRAENLTSRASCMLCQGDLSNTPRVLCAECPSSLIMCLSCLTTGNSAAHPTHLRTHKYYILDRLSFPLFHINWTAMDELNLILALEKYGMDNWGDIADHLGGSKSPRDSEIHYYTYYYKGRTDKIPGGDGYLSTRDPLTGQIYIDNEKVKHSMVLRKNWEMANPIKERGDYDNSVGGAESPLRIKGMTYIYIYIYIYTIEEYQDSVNEVVGYMPLRGDFTVEYDNDAELLLADMEFFEDDKPSEVELKLQILKLYNHRLDERIRRKKFVIERQLLDIKKQQNLERKRGKEEREIYNHLKVFMRFCTPEEYHKLVEALVGERELKMRVEELKYFRSKGLSNFDQVDKFMKQQKKEGEMGYRIGKQGERGIEKEYLFGDNYTLGRNKHKKEDSSAINQRPTRGKDISYAITSSAGYDKLTSNEKDLCINLQILPVDYTDLKIFLVNESNIGHQVTRSTATIPNPKLNREKAFTIYDFLVNNMIISSKEQGK